MPLLIMSVLRNLYMRRMIAEDPHVLYADFLVAYKGLSPEEREV